MTGRLLALVAIALAFGACLNIVADAAARAVWP